MQKSSNSRCYYSILLGKWYKYDLMLEKSIGLGIDEGVRLHAARICDIQREEMAVEYELSKLVSEPQFLPYRKVFARFGFGRRVEALLLSQIYQKYGFKTSSFEVGFT